NAAYYGRCLPANFFLEPRSGLASAAQRAATSYPFEPRRSDQLMNEAGFVRGADGFYATGAQGRFTTTLSGTASGADVSGLAAAASFWRQNGFDVQETVLPVAQNSDPEIGSTFPGMSTRTTKSSAAAIDGFTSKRIPRPENRWVGNNRGGWSNSSYDRLAD